VTGWRNFRGNLPALAAHFRCLILEFPGFGVSDDTGEHPMLGAGAAVSRFLNGLGIERAAVIGNSMGGIIGAQAAIAHPDRVSRLVTIGGVGTNLFSPARSWAVFRVPADFKVAIRSVFGRCEARLVRWAQATNPRRIRMRNRTRVIAAAAAVTAALAGSTAAAMASTPAATPTIQAKTVSAGAKCTPGTDVATRLGVSPDRLDQALRAVKTSFRNTGGEVTQNQFDVAVARNLGISQVRVHQAFAARNPGCAKPGGSKPGGSQAAPSQDEEQAQAAMTAVVARELHISTARVTAALRPIFAAGHADPDSPAFAAAARSLGVNTQQLVTALMHAKESLTGGQAGSKSPKS
jgi:pimeloyl-ACP methyl ester carboxylesterase